MSCNVLMKIHQMLETFDRFPCHLLGSCEIFEKILPAASCEIAKCEICNCRGEYLLSVFSWTSMTFWIRVHLSRISPRRDPGEGILGPRRASQGSRTARSPQEQKPGGRPLPIAPDFWVCSIGWSFTSAKRLWIEFMIRLMLQLRNVCVGHRALWWFAQKELAITNPVSTPEHVTERCKGSYRKAKAGVSRRRVPRSDPPAPELPPSIRCWKCWLCDKFGTRRLTTACIQFVADRFLEMLQ